MLNKMLLSICNFKFSAIRALQDWPIDKLEKFLEQASNVNNDDEKIKELYKKYLPKQFDFYESSYIPYNKWVKYVNEELLEKDNSKDEQLKLINDEMIMELAGDFLEDTIIPIVKDMLKK